MDHLVYMKAHSLLSKFKTEKFQAQTTTSNKSFTVNSYIPLATLCYRVNPVTVTLTLPLFRVFAPQSSACFQGSGIKVLVKHKKTQAVSLVHGQSLLFNESFTPAPGKADALTVPFLLAERTGALIKGVCQGSTYCCAFISFSGR